VHHKARRLLADQILEFNIKFRDTPHNLPDLHPYEHLHKDQKRIIKEYRKSVRSAAAAVQLEAEMQMIKIWCDNTEFNFEVRKRMHLSYFKGLAKRSRDSTPKYGNRYKDSL
jgi:hypothetical protein